MSNRGFESRHRRATTTKTRTSSTKQNPRRNRLRFEPLEDRQLLAADVTPVYSVTNSWNTGFQATIQLENHDAAALDDWQLEFDMLAEITSIWNAKIESRVGNHYTIVGAAWNDSIRAGGSVDFGFVASAASPPATPTDYVINGGPVGDPTPTLPSISISDATAGEGDSGSTNVVFSVSLSDAAPSDVTVAYATVAGSAVAGEDFDQVAGTITFAAGQTEQSITVVVRGDTQVESDETFRVELSAAEGATISDGQATGTITNDDVAPAPTGDFLFAVGSDWGSGFTAQIAVGNSTDTPIDDWHLEFDFAGDITTIWNAEVVSHTGNHFVIKNAPWNSTIAAGGTVSFGFNGSPGNLSTEPTNYVLRSGSGGTGTEPRNRAPVATDDLAFTVVGQSVTIRLLANDSDPDGDALAVAEISQPTHGTVVLNADSTVLYTPHEGFVGSDAFVYTLRDSAGATATGQVSVTVSTAQQGEWPDQVFAPYIDMTLYPIYNFLETAQAEGLRYFTLAFVVADPSNQPAWGGYSAYGLGTEYDTQLRQQIAGLRALGGDVIVSFGGAANRELAEVITNVADLQAAYQSVIDAYGLTHVDFDIEGAAVADRVSVDRRNAAIAGLQRDAAAAGRALHVSYTLPVLPTGLTPDGVYVIDSAIRHGVDVGVVNIMAMDYGDGAAPNPDGRMGDYAIAAAQSLFAQMQTLYGTSKSDAELWQMVGVTPMIGLNDVLTETFDQQEARELLVFAQQMGIGRLSFWSLNRDQQHPDGELGRVDLMSSSILQDPFEFSHIFDAITG